MARHPGRLRASAARSGSTVWRRRSPAATPRCAPSASCSTPRPSGAPRGWSCVVRPGRRRQVAAGLGVPQVRRRAGRASCAGTAAAACRTARASSFWALAEIVRQRFGIAEDDLPEIGGGQAGRGRRRSGCPTPDERALRRHPARPAARRRRSPTTPAASCPQEELFAGWRIFFERMAARRAGRAHGRGRAARRRGAAGLPRPPRRLVPRPADLRAGLRPAGARAGPARLRHRPQPGRC